jgi:hypothetical protein
MESLFYSGASCSLIVTRNMNVVIVAQLPEAVKYVLGI